MMVRLIDQWKGQTHFIYFVQVIFKLISVIYVCGISCSIAFRWLPLEITDDKATHI